MTAVWVRESWERGETLPRGNGDLAKARVRILGPGESEKNQNEDTIVTIMKDEREREREEEREIPTINPDKFDNKNKAKT